MNFRGLFEKIESTKISFPIFIGSFFSLVIIRTMIDGFGTTIFDLPNYTGLLLVMPLFYLNVLLAFLIIFSVFVRRPLRKLAPVALYGLLLIFVPPILDLFLPKKPSPPFLLLGTDNFFQKFATFLFDPSALSLTWGSKVQLILFVVFIIVYIAIQTRNFWRTIWGGIVTYVTIFFLAALIPLASILILSLQKGVLSASTIEVLNFVVNSQNSLLVSYEDPVVYSGVFISLVSIPLLAFLLFIFCRLTMPKKLSALYTAIRPTRLFAQFALLGIGCFFALAQSHRLDIFTPQLILSSVVAGLAIFFSWIFSVFLNDIADIDIDRVTNPLRPLPQRIIQPGELKYFAIAAAIVTLLCALALGYKIFFLFSVTLAIGYLYSTPPFRLKKWLFVSNIAMGTTGTILFAAGFLLFNPNNTLVNLPPAITILVFVVMTLLASVKDLKDYAGDLAGGAHTVLTVWGLKKGKLIIALMAFVAIMLFPILLRQADLLWISLAFGTAQIFVILDKRSRELWVFGVMLIYVFLVYLIAF